MSNIIDPDPETTAKEESTTEPSRLSESLWRIYDFPGKDPVLYPYEQIYMIYLVAWLHCLQDLSEAPLSINIYRKR